MKTYGLILIILLTFIHVNGQTWQWGARFGGLSTGPNNDNPDESIRDIITDNEGNVYFCGTVRQPSNANGNILTTYGAYDIIVGKLDCHGNLAWVKTAGGFFEDFANSIYQDDVGNLYVTGQIEATINNPCNLFGTIVTDNTTDLFLSKLDTAGNVLWNKVASLGFPSLLTYGYHLKKGLNNNIDMLFRVALDGELFPGDSVTRGWWLATMDTSGTILSKFLFAYDINPFPVFDFDTGPNGDHYFIGTFGQGWDSASVGGQMIYRTNPAGGNDFVFFKFDNANNLQWLNQIGDTTFRFIEGSRIMVTSNDEVYIGGSIFNGVIFGNDTMFNTIGGANNNFPFLAKYNNQGVSQWGIGMSTTFSCEMSGGIIELPNGNIGFSGYFTVTGQIDSFNVSGSGKEIFIGEITPNRDLLSVVTFPSGPQDYPQELVCDTSGNLYLSGAFSGSFTINGITNTSGGGMTDGFVAKYGYICTTSLEEIISGNDFISLYPNPSIDIVYFKLKNESRSTLLSVYNSLGSKVYEATIPANDSDYYSIDISKLSSGVYFLQLKTSSGISSGKFVKTD